MNNDHEAYYKQIIITFLLLCIVIDLSSNNQPDALIIKISSVTKFFGHLLCPSSGVLYCTFGTGKFHAGFDDRFQAESGCTILTLLGNGHQKPDETYQCRMYGRKLLMMGKVDARNM